MLLAFSIWFVIYVSQIFLDGIFLTNLTDCFVFKVGRVVTALVLRSKGHGFDACRSTKVDSTFTHYRAVIK